MRRISIRMRALIAVVVAIAIIAGVVFYLKPRPTVSLLAHFTITGYCHHFSGDGSLIAVYEYPPNYKGPNGVQYSTGQSIYDAKLGTVRLRLPSVKDAILFSSDSTFAAVPGKGVYDLRSGQLLLALGSDGYSFSPDSRFVATSADGVYELASSKRVVSAKGPLYWFSPDSRFVADSAGGVYELASGNQVVAVKDSSWVAFSHDSRFAALISNEAGDAVYDLTTGRQMFSAPRDKAFGTNAYFTPDGKYLTVENDGIYRVATGEKIVQTGALSFTANSAMAATAYGIFDLAAGKRLFPETLATWTTAYSKFSSDGKVAVILTYEPPASPNDAIITTVFDIPSRKTLFQISNASGGQSLFRRDT